MSIFQIMDRESTNNSEVYLYEKEGKWFAYEHSASLLQPIYEKPVKQKKQPDSFYSNTPEKMEVDLDKLLVKNWFVALCSDTEIVLIKIDLKCT